jgi:hypothetical protein
MGDVGDGQMTGHDGHGIGKDEILMSVEYGLLWVGETIRTEKTGAAADIRCIDLRIGAR